MAQLNKRVKNLKYCEADKILFPLGCSSENTLSSAVGTVKQPFGFFQDQQVFFIFWEKKEAWLCDSKVMVISERHRLVAAPGQVIHWELDKSNMHGCQLNNKVDST